jgi:fibronectin type 3 domain-containing protein
VTRFLQVAGRAATVVLCSLLLILMFSASRLLHRSRLPQGRATATPHSVDLKWKASPSRVVGYNVYRSEKTGGPFMKLTSNPVMETNFTDPTVQGDHTYFYMVTAVDSERRESLYSNQIKVVVP